MARLPILTYPDPRLTEVAAPVTDFGSTLHTLLDDMFDTMLAAKGIGLAAPQVGRLLRAFVVDLGAEEGYEAKRYEFINPHFSHPSGKAVFEEGCLSVPGIGEPVVRKNKITVHYQDRYGLAKTLQAEELLAVVIQHENDHLDGILFLDRLAPLKRIFAQRRAKQWAKG